ncbi:MAG: SGNH/GDSL hydrolase family protein [Mucilaginibacter sp.]
MKTLFTLLWCLVTVLDIKAQAIVKSDDPHIHYMGRTDKKGDATELAWPGTSVKINFNGTGVKAILKDNGVNDFYNIIVDNKVIKVIRLDTAKNTYTLAEGLPVGPHSLELFKRTEWAIGKSMFYGFTLDKGGVLLKAPATKKRKIEYYGDSITCGYAVEDSTGKDRGTGPFEDNYVSYAAIIARHFDAEYSCIARSGIGVMISWFPQIMPEMYNLKDPANPKSLWDFNKYTPDVIVVNLFQNDSWIVANPNNDQFKLRFGTKAPTADEIIAKYKALISNIRNKYPHAYIICALGSMDATKAGSVWPEYIEKAVLGLDDKKVLTHFFADKKTPGHPNVREQQAMADDLIGFIDQNIKW